MSHEPKYMLFVPNIRFVDKVIKVAPFFWKTIYDFNLQLLSDDTIKVFWKNESNLKQNISWFCCQKQVFQARITNHTPQFTVRCNYLSLPEIPDSGNKVVICSVPKCTFWDIIIEADTSSYSDTDLWLQLWFYLIHKKVPVFYHLILQVTRCIARLLREVCDIHNQLFARSLQV